MAIVTGCDLADCFQQCGRQTWLQLYGANADSPLPLLLLGTKLSCSFSSVASLFALGVQAVSLKHQIEVLQNFFWASL